ncbi:MAG: lytic murein transglycosylase B [Xanthomonadales bacterium]|nr:lytic murein transglycosylase B [Xanthomonadales bacterium]
MSRSLVSFRSCSRFLLLSACAIALPVSAADDAREALAREIAAEKGLTLEQVLPALSQAAYQQRIIDAISKPAEAKPWKAYRPIFMTDRRISDGRAFLAEHATALRRVSDETGVPPEIIVAIIGVETNYGKITGSFRVIDALYTLGVHYPPRQAFFRAELGHLFELANKQGLDLTTVKGSYAGAMGWGQFMPSSYLAYARDGDGDGRIDLFSNLDDVFASVANYFVAHGWQRGGDIAVAAEVAADAKALKPASLKPEWTLAELAANGYRPARALGHDSEATLIKLDGERGTEIWLGFQNFYVISRYNRSPLYSLAVTQLAEAIASGQAAAGP